MVWRAARDASAAMASQKQLVAVQGFLRGVRTLSTYEVTREKQFSQVEKGLRKLPGLTAQQAGSCLGALDEIERVGGPQSGVHEGDPLGEGNARGGASGGRQAWAAGLRRPPRRSHNAQHLSLAQTNPHWFPDRIFGADFRPSFVEGQYDFLHHA